MMKEVIFSIWLGIQGYFDLKFKEIPLWLSLLGGGAGVVFSIIENREFSSLCIACVPGILCLFFSWLTKEVMGYGDGIVFLVMGTYMSVSQLLSIGMMAFILAGIVALILLVVFHKKGKEQIPFIPFLAVTYVLGKIAEIGGIL